jgi:hypothetical protein
MNSDATVTATAPTAPTTFLYPLPWPYERGDAHRPKNVKRAEYLRVNTDITPFIAKAVGHMDKAVWESFDNLGIEAVFQVHSAKKLRKYVEIGLILVVEATSPADLLEKTHAISWRGQMSCLHGKQSALLNLCTEVAEMNTPLLDRFV